MSFGETDTVDWDLVLVLKIQCSVLHNKSIWPLTLPPVLVTEAFFKISTKKINKHGWWSKHEVWVIQNQAIGGITIEYWIKIRTTGTSSLYRKKMSLENEEMGIIYQIEWLWY